ncbi:MAG TPA: methyltransferase domain-containing protein [Methanoculleus sp.]|nr:methyltransferase domain-containing protein [Methanoculleus sp.]
MDKDVIPADTDLLHLSRGITMIGDIAILSLPPGLDAAAEERAGALVARRKNIRTVLTKVTSLEGDRRVARYRILAGSCTVTVHREFGFSYALDVREVFFNPRLASERMRVALQVSAGEEVLVPFAGVGPFVVPVAARGARVVAVEKSPAACRWLSENCRANGVEERVRVHEADAASLIGMYPPSFDRSVIPAPYGMDGMLARVARMVRPGGMIHFYTFKKRHQIADLTRVLDAEGYEVVTVRRCGNVAPCVSRWVFDLQKA